MATTFTNPLDSIRVASPCSANWDEMIGNNRERFCGQCKLNVYNLSGMTKREAENLIMNSEGRLCARFFRRADGTVITKDCPVGWKALKKRMSTIGTAVASLMFTALGSIGLTTYLSQSNSSGFGTTMGEITVDENSNRTFDEQAEFTMGNVAVSQEKEPVVKMGEIEKVEPNRNKAIIGRMVIPPK